MIRVNQVQRGNGLLEYLNTSSWHFDSTVTADYEINFSVSVLFLSLRFHSCKPEYIYKRINKMKESRTKALIVLVDTENFNLILRELFDMVTLTIVLCKNNDECAKYLKGFDLGTKSTVNSLRNKESSIETFLESFPRLNKTNIELIRRSYNNLQELFRTDATKLGNHFGMSKKKAEDFLKYVKMPFNNNNSEM